MGVRFGKKERKYKWDLKGHKKGEKWFKYKAKWVICAKGHKITRVLKLDPKANSLYKLVQKVPISLQNFNQSSI